MMPLEGITILDFTQAYNGPYGTMILADLGARVIKVERLGGEQSRFWEPYTEDDESGYFALLNRNKEGLAVDLTEPEGKEIIKKLYAKVDVVVENFKFGTIDKLGLGYEIAKDINPNIIFASSSGYGQTGPLAPNTAYDNVIESMCGYMDMTGFPELPPLRSGASVADSYTGISMATGVMLALYNRKKTGEGKRVDVAMLDTMFASLEDSIMTYSLTGKPLRRSGNAKPAEIVPYDAYMCKDDKMITVTVTKDEMWPDFCKAINMPELIDDPLYATNDLRVENLAVFTEMMKQYMSTQDADDMAARFQKHNVPASTVYRPIDAAEHPHMLARDMIITYQDDNIGEFTTFGLPIKFSKTPEKIRKGSPKIGGDTVSIMKELGYDQTIIDNYIKEEIVEIPEE